MWEHHFDGAVFLWIESTFFFVAGIYLLATVVLLLVPLSAGNNPSENGAADN